VVSFLLVSVLFGQVDGGASDAGISLPALNRKPLQRAVDEKTVQRVFETLSSRERAAQLILAYPQINKTAPVEVGGILFVGNTLKSPQKAKERIADAISRAKIKPFVAVDMEGGPSNRLKSVKSLRALPSAQEMGLLTDAEVKTWGKKVGESMRALGLNMNLAPVFDVSSSGHMFTNGRSFSGNSSVALAKASAYAKGLLEAGVVPIGKHFPGYGNVDGDSDHALVVADWPKEQVISSTQIFFDAKNVLAGVMLANVAYASINERPAILAPELLALVHKNESWIAVTDDISIQLLADTIKKNPEDVLKAALLAGNDLLLTTAPPDWDKGLDYVGILTKLGEENEVAKKRIDESVLRILRLKERMGLLKGL
jgi:beta-N-acetylhexosaminidase